MVLIENKYVNICSDTEDFKIIDGNDEKTLENMIIFLRKSLETHKGKINKIKISFQLKRSEEQTTEKKKREYEKRVKKKEEKLKKIPELCKRPAIMEIKASEVTIKSTKEDGSIIENSIKRNKNDARVEIHTRDYSLIEESLVENVILDNVPDFKNGDFIDHLLISQNQRNTKVLTECIQLISSAIWANEITSMEDTNRLIVMEKYCGKNLVLKQLFGFILKHKVDVERIQDYLRLDMYYELR